MQISSSSALPSDVLVDIIGKLDPSSRGILKHVSKGMRHIIHVNEERGLQAGRIGRLRAIYRTPTVCSLSIRDMCASVELLRWARGQGCSLSFSACTMAAQTGNLDALKATREEGFPWDESTCIAAARNGDLAMLSWVIHQDCPVTELTCRAVAGNGHLQVLKWMHACGCPLNNTWVCQNAAKGGYLKVENALQL